MFYGLSSILQRSHLTWLQAPLQVSGLAASLYFIFKRKEFDSVQALALGGVSYTTFIVLVSSTPQYVWAELLFLIYFLMNRPSADKVMIYA